MMGVVAEKLTRERSRIPNCTSTVWNFIFSLHRVKISSIDEAVKVTKMGMTIRYQYA